MSSHDPPEPTQGVERVRALHADLRRRGFIAGKRPPPLARLLWNLGVPVPPQELTPWWVLGPWIALCSSVMATLLLGPLWFYLTEARSRCDVFEWALTTLVTATLCGLWSGCIFAHAAERFRRRNGLPYWFHYKLGEPEGQGRR
jgi:hypothetical protein